VLNDIHHTMVWAKQGPSDGTQILDLRAAGFAAQCPCTKMLTVVPQDVVVVFSQARARPLQHFMTIEASVVVSHSHGMALSETFERNFLYRPAPKSVHQTRVVNDAPVANIDAVMAVEGAWRDKVGCERRLLGGGEKRVARR
jgi:hypothetical protein